jgi:hypothetical protein
LALPEAFELSYRRPAHGSSRSPLSGRWVIHRARVAHRSSRPLSATGKKWCYRNRLNQAFPGQPKFGATYGIERHLAGVDRTTERLTHQKDLQGSVTHGVFWPL